MSTEQRSAMHLSRRWIAVVVGWISVNPAPGLGAGVAAQDDSSPPGSTVTVTGNVLSESTGEPIVGVAVRVNAANWSDALVTDALGQFRLDLIRVGTYSIALSHDDHQPLEGDLTIDRSGEFFLAMTPLYEDREGMTGIVGVIRDIASGRPIRDAAVNVPVLGRTTTSDSDGRFILAETVPGRYEIVFIHLGYRPRTDTVHIVRDRVSRLDVAMAVEAIALAPMEVTVERRDLALQRVGFYEREEDGWGDFVDREDLELWNPVDLTDALIRLPGVKIVHDPRMPSQRYLLFRSAGTECFPSVYVDGMLMHIGGSREPARINDILDPIAVAGIEVYRRTAGMPPQYWGVNSSCGVIAIWVRRS